MLTCLLGLWRASLLSIVSLVRKIVTKYEWLTSDRQLVIRLCQIVREVCSTVDHTLIGKNLDDDNY